MDRHQIVIEALAIINGLGILVLLLKNLLDMRKHRLEMRKLEHEIQKLSREKAVIVPVTEEELRRLVIEPFSEELHRRQGIFSPTMPSGLRSSFRETEWETTDRLEHQLRQLLERISDNTEVMRQRNETDLKLYSSLEYQLHDLVKIIAESTAVQVELLQLLNAVQLQWAQKTAAESPESGERSDSKVRILEPGKNGN